MVVLDEYTHSKLVFLIQKAANIKLRTAMYLYVLV